MLARIPVGIASAPGFLSLAKNNLAEGFENNRTGTTYTNNVAKGNRAAFANSGTIAMFEGNEPGTVVMPAVD